jgi:hypothetical protein
LARAINNDTRPVRDKLVLSAAVLVIGLEFEFGFVTNGTYKRWGQSGRVRVSNSFAKLGDARSFCSRPSLSNAALSTRKKKDA